MKVNLSLKSSADGWRGVIGDNFSKDAALKIVEAVISHLGDKNNIVIAYDGRFYSKETAYYLANALVGKGFLVSVCGLLSTPVLTDMVGILNCSLGIQVTSSHNPFYWNGIKIKSSEDLFSDKSPNHLVDNLCSENKGALRIISNKHCNNVYLKKLFEKLELDTIQNIRMKNLKIAADTLHGAAGEIFEKFFTALNCNITMIGKSVDPLFNGIQPDPMNPISRKRITDFLSTNSADISFVTDGDGDRLCVFDDLGNFIWPHDILALLLTCILKDKNNYAQNKGISITAPTGSIVEKIAKKHGIKVIYTPVGFKHVSLLMKEKKIFFGGGAVGEFAYDKYSYDRDPLVGILILLTLLSKTKMTISELIADLYLEYGDSYYCQWTFPVMTTGVLTIENYKTSLENNLCTKTIREENIDGMKYIFSDSSWVLFRESTTEYGLRVYAEMQSQEQLKLLYRTLCGLTMTVGVEKA